MFDCLADLETAIEKVGADASPLDVERINRLSEQLEFLRLRAIGDYNRSGEWSSEGFATVQSAVRAKCRCSHGHASRSVTLARKLERLPEMAAAFAAGEITREHAEMIAGPYTRKRAEMLSGIELELVAFARAAMPEELRDAVKVFTDAFDGGDGGDDDDKERDLNEVTLSPSLGGRGMLHGTLDTETTDLVLTALDAEIEQLRNKGETRKMPQLRADAVASICRQYLIARGSTDARGRGQTHVSVVWDLRTIDLSNPDVAALARADTAHGGRLSRATMERLTCDCKISRIITDGPSQIIDVGRATRTVGLPLWNALVARDQHCTHAGCQRGPGFCEAHHIWHWEHGGPTNLENLKLLCWFHHWRQHILDARYGYGHEWSGATR